jgi:hypothetical protein
MLKRRQVINYFPFLFGFLPFISAGLVSLPFYHSIENWVFVAAVVVTMIMTFVIEYTREKNELLNRIFFSMVVFMMLILVQNTGWFYSPFLFVLFLTTVACVLLYSFWAGAFFLGSISVLFLSYVDRTTPWYDYVRILSFFTALPLSVVFSSEFLRLKQNDKKILILEEESAVNKGELERLRRNRLIWNDVLLRQSLATARNFVLYWDGNSSGLPPKLQRDLKRTARKLDEALENIKKFEKKTVDETYL